MWYSFEDDFCLSGWAHLKAVGVPDNVCLDGIGDNEQRSLAGEAFGAPCIGQVLICFYSNPFAPWWGDGTP